MKKVLVTGASGFVGRYCLPILQANEFEVHAVSSRAAGVTTSGIHWHQADLLEAHESASLVLEVRPTHLLHLAWHAVPGKYWSSTENIRWVRASLSLLQSFAEQGGERVVMAGTCAEYDWKDGFCSEKSTRLVPATLYGVCKHALQLMLAAYAAETNLSAAWGRLFSLYGPHENPDRLVASVIRSLLKNDAARCSAGDQQRDFLFVEDAASALVTLLKSDVRGPVNVASGQALAVKEVVRRIAELLNRPELLEFGAISTAPYDPPLLVADVGRLQKEVGWTPRFDLNQGLALTIDSWRRLMSKK